MRIGTEKAIEILKLTPEYTEDGEPIGEAEARELGIEALRCKQTWERFWAKVFIEAVTLRTRP